MSALTYLVIRCHGLKTRLISPSMLTSMARAEDMKAFTEALLKTDYGDMIREVPWKDIDGFTLERIFVRKLVERCYFVSEISAPDIARFLRAYYRRFEVQNIRRILRGKVARTPKEQIEKSLIPIERYSSVNFDAILNSKGASDAVKLLAETIYSPSKEAIQLYESSGSLLPLEAYFEKAYAEELMKTIVDLPEDEEDVNRLIRVQFGIRNCITAVGGVTQELNPRLLESLIIPYSFKVSAADIVRMIHSDRASSLAPSVFNPYIRVVNPLLAREEAMAYVEGLRYIYKNSESVRRMRTYSLAFILTYVISCEIEQRDLTSIALGKEYNVSPDDIIAHLVIQ